MTIVGNGQMKPTPQTQPARRMSLAAVHKPRTAEAWRGMLYSPEGLGKTTFGAAAPHAVFIAPESGFPRGIDANLFPQPRHWNDLYDAIRELLDGQHPYRTLVIDTIDWLQPLLFTYICERAQVDSIEKVEGGYGRGYDKATSEIVKLLGHLETLRQRRNMNILILGHAEITTFKNPSGADFDRWEPKLQKKISAKVREWSDWVLFGNFEIATVSGGKKKTAEKELTDKAKVVNSSSGVRMLYTSLQPLYYAKNRYGMPSKLAFSYSEVAKYLEGDKEALAERCQNLRNEIDSVLKQLHWDAEKKTASRTWAEKETVPGKLQEALNRLNSKLEDQMAAAEAAAAEAEQEQRAMPDDVPPVTSMESSDPGDEDELDTDEDPLSVNDPLDRNDHSHNDPTMFEGEGWGGEPTPAPSADPQPVAAPPPESKPAPEAPQGPDPELEAVTRQIFACKTSAEVEAVRADLQAQRERGELRLSKVQGRKIRESFESKLKTLEAAAQ